VATIRNRRCRMEMFLSTRRPSEKKPPGGAPPYEAGLTEQDEAMIKIAAGSLAASPVIAASACAFVDGNDATNPPGNLPLKGNLNPTAPRPAPPPMPYTPNRRTARAPPKGHPHVFTGTKSLAPQRPAQRHGAGV